MSSIAQLLQSTLDPDYNKRTQAESQLTLLSKSNYSEYMKLLSYELVNDKQQSLIRHSAGLALKNTLTSKDTIVLQTLQQQWNSLATDIKHSIKSNILSTLYSTDSTVAMSASQCISAIASIELQYNQWNELLPQLLQQSTDTTNPIIRQHSLNTLGLICESVDKLLLLTHSNSILTVIMSCARKEESNDAIRISALQALLNSLEFISANFSVENERNFIMQVVCECTQSSTESIQLLAFESLAKIMSLYYTYMSVYVEKALFGLTVHGMKSNTESIQMQAIEFWSTVCDREADLMYSEEECYRFANAAYKDIVGVLLELMIKPSDSEGEDEEEWNLHSSASTCLSLFAQAVGDVMVELVVVFVSNHIQSNAWNYRECAVNALGCILEGPSSNTLLPIVTQALPVLLVLLKDTSVAVRETTAWTIGRICLYCVDGITVDVTVSALLEALDDNPRVVVNCCLAFINIAKGVNVGDYIERIIGCLLRVTDTITNEHHSRTSAYEAMSSLVSTCPNVLIVENLVSIVLVRIESSHHQQSISVEDRFTELQSNLLGVLTSIIRRLGKGIFVIADRVMSTLLTLLSTAPPHSPILEDLFMCVDALLLCLESDFSRYLSTFSPFLFSALQNNQEYQICSIAVGLLGDVFRSIPTESTNIANDSMTILVSLLSTPTLHYSVKPFILTAISDIALSLNASFVVFTPVVLQILVAASQTRPTNTSLEQIDYIHELNESILTCYVSLIQALQPNHTNALEQHLSTLFGFCQVCCIDEERTENCVRGVVGLIGDVADGFGESCVGWLRESWVDEIIRESRGKGMSEGTREVGKWAREMVRRVVGGFR